MEYVIGLIGGGIVFLIGFLFGYSTHGEAKEIVQLALNDRKQHMDLLERRTAIEKQMIESVQALTHVVQQRTDPSR